MIFDWAAAGYYRTLRGVPRSAAVAQALAQAQEAGELSKDADVGALARFLVDSYEGAAARAKLIGDRAPMDEFIRTTFDFLLA